MTSLQGPGRQNDPEPYADLIAQLVELRRQLGDLPSSVLRSAGIRVSDEGMVIDSSLDVNGALDVSGPATVSGTLGVSGSANFSGNTTIGGNAAITGTLSLPAGIINNAALANPVTFASDIDSSTNIALGVTRGTYHTASTVTVPAGFTKAQTTSIASCNVSNTTGSTQYVFLSVRVEASNGAWQYSGTQTLTLAAGFWGSLIVPMMWETSGLMGGDTITTKAEIWATAALSADPGHWIATELTATFTR